MSLTTRPATKKINKIKKIQRTGRSRKEIGGSSGGGSRLSHWHADINRAADGLFYRLGRQVALNPKKVVALALFGVLLCSSGFTNFRVESSGKRAEYGKRWM